MAMSELTLSAEQATNLVLALRAVERLPVLTEDIIQATEEGEPYETLCRQLRGLHGNLVEIAAFAAQASFSGVSTLEALQPGCGFPPAFGDNSGDRTPYTVHAANTSALADTEALRR